MSVIEHTWTILHRTDWGHAHDSLLPENAPVPEGDEQFRVIEVVPAEQLQGAVKERDEWRRISAEQQADYGKLQHQLQGAVNLDDEAVIERATRALCDEEWWEDDWMTAMNVVGIVFQAAKGGQ
jgi:hypothetical protein